MTCCNCKTFAEQLEAVKNKLSRHATELEALHQDLCVERVGRLFAERRVKPRNPRLESSAYQGNRAAFLADKSWAGQAAALKDESKEP